MEKETHDHLFKFIIIGNANTGKSCLLHYFIENQYKKMTSHTVGVEFGSKVLTLGSKKIKLQIWDTAGQERFRAVSKTYYRGAVGALILYDITNKDSFSCLNQWLKDARDLARPDITCILIGNKSDLKDNREVNNEEALKFAEENNIKFLETSALTGDNVHEAFQSLSKIILDKIESGSLSLDTNSSKTGAGKITNNAQKKNEGRCSYCS